MISRITTVKLKLHLHAGGMPSSITSILRAIFNADPVIPPSVEWKEVRHVAVSHDLSYSEFRDLCEQVNEEERLRWSHTLERGLFIEGTLTDVNVSVLFKLLLMIEPWTLTDGMQFDISYRLREKTEPVKWKV